VTTNPCNNSPCQNGGTCYNLGSGSYSCQCASGWTGNQCQTSTNPCDNFPCQNGGTCYNLGSGSYSCQCASGWTGNQCQTFVTTNPCNNSPCQNGGTCYNLGSGSYSCQCASGWTGNQCQTFVTTNPCNNSPCQNGGTCYNLGSGSYSCQCASGWTGNQCQTSTNPCDNFPCQNGGTCYNLGSGSYSCQCASGWTGNQCQTFVATNPCDNSPCLNGGTCYNLGGGSYSCQCASGWTGNQCQTFVTTNPCDNFPCQNGGTCTNLGSGSYSCQCASGWTGNQCQTFVSSTNMCLQNLCLNGATCVNNGNSQYTCICRPDYVGTNCGSSRESTPSLDACQSSPCHSLSNCYNTYHSTYLTSPVSLYVCVCHSNYLGVNCDSPITDYPDLNMCSTNPCQSGGTCHNTFDNDGPGITSKVCMCTVGWVGNTCEIIATNPCSSNPCQNSGTCVAFNTYYTCTCATGYAGTQCQTPDTGTTPCSSDPCPSNQMCYYAGNQYICIGGRRRRDVSTEGSLVPLHGAGVICNTTISVNHTVNIFSPQFPRNYPDNEFCWWIIEVDGNSKIRVNFEYFATEEHFDWLDIGHGDVVSAETDVHASGLIRPTSFTSSGKKIWITFKSDHEKTENGFWIQVTSIPNIETSAFAGCSLNPCQNGGTCLLHRGRSICICAHGYLGDYCEHEMEHTTQLDTNMTSVVTLPFGEMSVYAWSVTAICCVLFVFSVLLAATVCRTMHKKKRVLNRKVRLDDDGIFVVH
ncbi:uncharacterized protein LOC100376577, partial [Saccoglossus kowalevskii]|uniref:Neurogenic locus notch homolog protein 2-like n=1 Tax=Saccoglossus kowalevskii TaxID=10224 RepID=A0ABM0MDS8_SACKO